MKIAKALLAGAMALGALTGCGLIGCGVKTASQPGAPTLTFARSTNAKLQAAHAYADANAGNIASGKQSCNPACASAVNQFGLILDAADQAYIQFEAGQITQAEMSAALAKAKAAQSAVQAASTSASPTGGN